MNQWIVYKNGKQKGFEIETVTCTEKKSHRASHKSEHTLRVVESECGRRAKVTFTRKAGEFFDVYSMVHNNRNAHTYKYLSDVNSQQDQ